MTMYPTALRGLTVVVIRFQSRSSQSDVSSLPSSSAIGSGPQDCSFHPGAAAVASLGFFGQGLQELRGHPGKSSQGSQGSGRTSPETEIEPPPRLHTPNAMLQMHQSLLHGPMAPERERAVALGALGHMRLQASLSPPNGLMNGNGQHNTHPAGGGATNNALRLNE